MEDRLKTRQLLIAELEAERQHRKIVTELLRSAEYAFTHLPFDHASRRGVLIDVRRYLQLPAEGSTVADHRVLTRTGIGDARAER